MLRGFQVAAFLFIAAAAVAQTQTVWDSVYSAAQADRGKDSYTGACASCHGRGLEGGHIFGSRTRTAPALKGELFLANWYGLTAGELFLRISQTMPLDHPQSLSDETSTDLVAYILQTNGFPAGSRDLPADVDVLKNIQIAAQKK